MGNRDSNSHLIQSFEFWLTGGGHQFGHAWAIFEKSLTALF